MTGSNLDLACGKRTNQNPESPRFFCSPYPIPCSLLRIPITMKKL
jgi:hypothetical protein